MAIERIVDTSSHDDDSEEQRIEVSLRPQSFAEYVGQERLKRNLRLALMRLKSAASRWITYYYMVRLGLVKQLWRR